MAALVLDQIMAGAIYYFFDRKQGKEFEDHGSNSTDLAVTREKHTKTERTSKRSLHIWRERNATSSFWTTPPVHLLGVWDLRAA
jgi:hypothetical protein